MRYLTISAPKRFEILRTSLRSMVNAGIEPDSVEIILGADFTTESAHERAVIVTNMHLGIWQMVKHSTEPLVVFEDDAFFIRRCQMPPLGKSTMFFFGVNWTHFKEYNHGGLSTLSSAKGSHGYVITPSVASILLQAPWDYVDRITDYCIRNNWIEGVVQTPYACYQMPHASNLGGIRGPWFEAHSGEHNGRLIPATELLQIGR